MQKLVVQKGYTITVKSWENDADYRQTHSIVVATKEEAMEWDKLMKLCKNDGILGNTYDSFRESQLEAIHNFMANTILETTYEGYDEDFNEDANSFEDLVYDLLGYSPEKFKCRVAESCVITYSDKDIYCDIIKF